ncbi:hypothetical protein [Paenibacillus sp. y28]|uniref:hypothetical protein n=1 Tax=Paenibacillus sp. y28 TaxID=3129110 RepID=UPI0030189BD2
MSWFTRILLTMLASCGLAIGLTLVLQWSGLELNKGSELPVMRAVKTERIDEAGVVDLLTQVRLHADILRVDWRDSIISLDLAVNPAQSGKELIYEDLYNLVNHSFNRTANVKEVMVRVMERGSGAVKPSSMTLLLSMDAQRRYMGEPDSWNEALTPEVFVRSRFQMNFTPKWRQKYGL